MVDNYFNEKMERLSKTDLEKIQSERFARTIRNAAEKSPYYARAFKNSGVDTRDLNSIKDLRKAKFFTTKEDLRTNYPYGFLAVPRNQVAEMHATSGTTGTPTLGLHTAKDLNDWAEISARSLTMAGLTKDDVFQITPSLGMFSGGFGFYHGARNLGCTVVPASSGFSKRQISYMLDFGTTMFSAIVSYSFRLAEIAKDMGIDLRKDTRVRKGIFGSEIWTEETKKRIAQIWDLDPFDVYGFTELYGPGVGNDCRLHEGIHIWQDYFLVEVVDPKSGEPVDPEEDGELVFTTLAKEAMPLIRYRSRDIAAFLDSMSCDCGRTHNRFSEIKGRTDDMLKISGINFWPSEVERLLLKNPELGSEFTINVRRVASMDHVEINVESVEKISEEKKKDLTTKLIYEMKEMLLFSPTVIIVDPNSLPRTDIGKSKRVTDDRRTGEAS